MVGKTKRRIIIAFKLIFAVLLLVWVLGRIHLHDYLVLRPNFGGNEVVLVQDNRGVEGGNITVSSGTLWWTGKEIHPAEHFQSVGEEGKIIRPGLISCLSDLNWPVFIAGILCFPLSLFIVALRLKYLLSHQSMHIPTGEVTSYAFLGHLFNFLIPGMVSGDLVKAWYIINAERHAGPVLVTMFVDRLLGLMELVLMAAVMVTFILLAGIVSIEQMKMPVISVGVMILLTAGGLAFLLLPGLRKATHLEKIYSRTSIAHHFHAAGNSTRIYRSHPWILATGLALTVIAHLFYIGGVAVIGFSLGLDIPWYYYFVYLPLIYIIGAVPVTPGGVGLVENLYVSMLGAAVISEGYHCTVTEIVTLAVLARVVMMAWGLPGLHVLIGGRHKKMPPTVDLEEELERVEEEEMQEGRLTV